MRTALLSYAIKARSQSAPTTPESGLTLIECLVAMIIITVTVAIITPPVFLAVGTRVNNRRTEQALQVGQGEIERVRLLMMSNQSFNDIETSLPKDSGVGPTQLQTAPAATTICVDGPPPAACSSATALYKVPGNSDLYIQTFRDAGKTIARTDPNTGNVQNEIIAFNLGVRVYSKEVLNAGGTALKGTLQTDEGSINFTSGTKSRGSKPLVTMYTEMIRSSQKESLTEMRDYIDSKY